MHRGWHRVLAVFIACGNYVVQVRAGARTTSDLYPGFEMPRFGVVRNLRGCARVVPIFVRNTFHSYLSVFSSVTREVMPAIHKTYNNDNKVYTYNCLVTRPGGLS